MDEIITGEADVDVDTLRLEISNLKSSLSSMKSELSASREKQDFFYNQCKQKDLKLRNMDAIIAANHRETLDMLVDGFINNGRVSLKKISSQIHIQEFDVDNQKIMDTLITYLHHLIEQMEALREQYK